MRVRTGFTFDERSARCSANSQSNAGRRRRVASGDRWRRHRRWGRRLLWSCWLSDRRASGWPESRADALPQSSRRLAEAPSRQ
jgi:hypothetical protein